MDLLSLAKDTLFPWALAIFLAGMLWRIVGILLLRGKRDLSLARKKDWWWKGLRLTALRSWPRKEFSATMPMELISYIFHFGLFAAVLLYLPHILFFENIIKGLIGYNLTDVVGFGWPYFPAAVISFVSTISVFCLIVVLIHRMVNPVKRLISNFDDYFSWFVTIAPLITGMLATSHIGGPYQILLALHILSVELLLVWFPFSKLMHVFTMFTARAVTGALFDRKGAAL